jgi:Bestrophin, RFP-TM, chloride channel
MKSHLTGFNVLWGQLLSVTTFTLTFFVNQSYSLWRKCYELSRRLQGRLNDVNMLLAIHATRKPPAGPNEQSTYTAGSRQILELVGRYIRLFNLLTYASFTRSHRPILTPRGMRRLVERGLMTGREREVLVDAELPATQRHTAILLWIARVFVEGREAGHFLGGAGFESEFLEKIHVTRVQYGSIGDELQGRMPLAYAHIVQVLVDVVLWLYPLAAISSGMSAVLSVLGTGLLTVSYQGLLNLAKQVREREMRFVRTILKISHRVGTLRVCYYLVLMQPIQLTLTHPPSSHTEAYRPVRKREPWSRYDGRGHMSSSSNRLMSLNQSVLSGSHI